MSSTIDFFSSRNTAQGAGATVMIRNYKDISFKGVKHTVTNSHITYYLALKELITKAIWNKITGIRIICY